MEEFDVIVVGAGPAGSTVAYLLAKAGINTLLIERGQTPGSKNVSGGLLYTENMNQVFPRFWEHAPVERAISSHSLVLLSQDTSLGLDFRKSSPSSSEIPCNAYSVLRAKLDPWLAEQAEAAGATLITSTTVDALLVENGQVLGIQAGPDKIGAKVTVDAEGSRSLLVKRAGLRTDFHTDEMSIGVKEVIRLPTDIIDQRFRCFNSEGIALTLVGHTGGLPGGGFIYTNRDSLSLGVVLKIKSLCESKRPPHDVLDEFKAHPFVAAMIANGEVAEYSAQSVHAGGLHLVPRLYGDGYVIVGSAARLLLNNVLTLRGMDLAVTSAKTAADAIVAAHAANDYSAAALAQYETLFKQTPVYRDMLTFRDVYPLLANKRFFELYPNLACDIMEQLFAVNTKPGKKVFGAIRDSLQGRVSWLDLTRDAWAVAKGLVI
jgi:electron transfer flavoprotein-quinone oxidoreductase